MTGYVPEAKIAPNILTALIVIWLVVGLIVTKSLIVKFLTEVEIEYNQLVSEQYGVNVEVGNVADAVAFYPNCKF